MLRWKLGDEKFFQAIRNYVNDPKLAYSYARTKDLQSHLEAIGGEDLTEFFKDWFYGQGYPSYEVVWSNADDGFDIILSQQQSDLSVSFFEMPVPILVSGQGKDTILVMNHEFSGQSFSFDLDFKVDTVVFDPELWLISKNNMIIHDLTGIEDVEDKEFISIYPNPFLNTMKITTINEKEMLIDGLEVYSILGKLIFTTSNPFREKSLNTNDWKLGTYIVKYQIGNKQYVKLIVK